MLEAAAVKASAAEPLAAVGNSNRVFGSRFDPGRVLQFAATPRPKNNARHNWPVIHPAWRTNRSSSRPRRTAQRLKRQRPNGTTKQLNKRQPATTHAADLLSTYTKGRTWASTSLLGNNARGTGATRPPGLKTCEHGRARFRTSVAARTPTAGPPRPWLLSQASTA